MKKKNIKDLIGTSTRGNKGGFIAKEPIEPTEVLVSETELTFGSFDRLMADYLRGLCLYIFWKSGGEQKEVVRKLLNGELEVTNKTGAIQDYTRLIKEGFDSKYFYSEMNDSLGEEFEDILALIRATHKLHKISIKSITTYGFTVRQQLYITNKKSER